MKTYSQDLREKVMAVVAAGKQSNRRIADTLGISESTIEKWPRRRRETGSLAPATHAGGTPRVLAPHQPFLRAAVKAQPDITLDELCTEVARELKLSVSPSMVSREFSQFDLARKKSRSTTANGRRHG